MAPGFVKKNLTFWGAVGGVMTALKLKEHLDGYRQVPDEEGRVALHSPLMGDEDFPENMTLDTEIPMARPNRKRCKDCCVCCGMRCGLFWKAFGIVCAVLLGWQLIRLVIWLVTPSPTGLEHMPTFDASLGCSKDAPHFYNGSDLGIVIPLGPNGDHVIDLNRGAAVGTIRLVDAHPRAHEFGYQLAIRTNDPALLDEVSLSIPTAEDIEAGATSRLAVALPSKQALGSACIRYDLLVFVPVYAKKLTIITAQDSATQVRVMPEANIVIDKLSVAMHGIDERNMLLPTRGLHAKDLELDVTNGWLVGEVAVVQQAQLQTQRGSAVAHVKVYPDPSPADAEAPLTATLETVTGAGRSDFFYISDRSFPHRPIASRHMSSRNGDLYLRYKEAEFNGRVSVKAKSYTATGVQGMMSRNGTTPWVGNPDGGDFLDAQTNNGWIGLYF